jgi:hypothetical protein
MEFEPSSMRFLHGAGSEQHELLIIQTANSEIPVEPGLTRQHWCQGEPARLRQVSR